MVDGMSKFLKLQKKKKVIIIVEIRTFDSSLKNPTIATYPSVYYQDGRILINATPRLPPAIN